VTGVKKLTRQLYGGQPATLRYATMTTMATNYSIFCDGACPGNGTPSARGGWAFALWNGDLSFVRGEPNVWASAPLTAKEKHTNQRAELTALLRSMEHALTLTPGTPVTFYTDSKYAMECTQTWGPKWAKDGWKRPSKEPLENLDLVMPMVAMWSTFSGANAWTLEHVKGHGKGWSPKVYGNNWVDREAVNSIGGAQRAGATTK